MRLNKTVAFRLEVFRLVVTVALILSCFVAFGLEACGVI